MSTGYQAPGINEKVIGAVPGTAYTLVLNKDTGAVRAIPSDPNDYVVAPMRAPFEEFAPTPKQDEPQDVALRMMVSRSMQAVIRKLAADYHIDTSDVILKAIGLLKTAREASNAGLKVSIVAENGEIVHDIQGV